MDIPVDCIINVILIVVLAILFVFMLIYLYDIAINRKENYVASGGAAKIKPIKGQDIRLILLYDITKCDPQMCPTTYDFIQTATDMGLEYNIILASDNPPNNTMLSSYSDIQSYPTIVVMNKKNNTRMGTITGDTNAKDLRKLLLKYVK